MLEQVVAGQNHLVQSLQTLSLDLEGNHKETKEQFAHVGANLQQMRNSLGALNERVNHLEQHVTDKTSIKQENRNTAENSMPKLDCRNFSPKNIASVVWRRSPVSISPNKRKQTMSPQTGPALMRNDSSQTSRKIDIICNLLGYKDTGSTRDLLRDALTDLRLYLPESIPDSMFDEAALHAVSTDLGLNAESENSEIANSDVVKMCDIVRRDMRYGRDMALPQVLAQALSDLDLRWGKSLTWPACT